MDTLRDLSHNTIFAGFVLVMTSLIIGYILHKKRGIFRSFNVYPVVSPHKPLQELGAYTVPQVVTTGMIISNFTKFDPLNNDFLLDGYVWFKFNPSLVPLQTLAAFSFERGTLIEKELSESRVLSTGEFFVQYRVRLEYSADLDFRNFPLDDHRLFLVLKLEGMSSDEIYLSGKNQGLAFSANMEQSGWKCINIGAYSGYMNGGWNSQIDEPLAPYPVSVFFLDFTRNGIRKILSILLPLIVIFYVGFLSLMIIPPSTGYVEDILIAAGALTGLLAYRFVIETMSPPVSYFTLSDHIFSLFLVATFVVFFINVFSLSRLSTPKSLELFKALGFIILPLFVLFSIFMMYRMMIQKDKK